MFVDGEKNGVAFGVLDDDLLFVGSRGDLGEQALLKKGYDYGRKTWNFMGITTSKIKE